MRNGCRLKFQNAHAATYVRFAIFFVLTLIYSMEYLATYIHVTIIVLTIINGTLSDPRTQI